MVQITTNKSQVSQQSRDNQSQESGKGSVFKKDYSVKRAMATANIARAPEKKENQ